MIELSCVISALYCFWVGEMTQGLIVCVVCCIYSDVSAVKRQLSPPEIKKPGRFNVSE